MKATKKSDVISLFNQLYDTDRIAWEALGKPQGTYDTTNTQRLAERYRLFVDALADLLNNIGGGTKQQLQRSIKRAQDVMKLDLTGSNKMNLDKERLLRLAELEDKAGSVSVGGLFMSKDQKSDSPQKTGPRIIYESENKLNRVVLANGYIYCEYNPSSDSFGNPRWVEVSQEARASLLHNALRHVLTSKNLNA